jgi:peptidoglycan/LPS O-acetylase OafA/YrhL
MNTNPAAISPARTSPPVSAAHVPVLDGIRGMAIGLVMVRHFAEFFLERGESVTMASIPLVDRMFYRVCSLGSVGVDLFFVLSGFLITGILIDSKERPNYFRRFYWRRTLRIFPLYYLTLALVFFVWPLFSTEWSFIVQDARAHQIWYWTYLPNVLFALKQNYFGLVHFWSLAVEEQFYLFWPFVVFLFARRGLVAMCLACIAVTVLLRAYFTYLNVSIIVSYVSLFTRMDALAIGGLLAIGARRPEGLAPYRKHAVVGAVLLTGLLVALVAMTPLTQGAGGRSHAVNLLGGTTIGAVFGALLLLTYTSAKGSILNVVFSSSPMRFLGKYSYCLYVCHVFVWDWVRVHWNDDMVPSIAGSLIPGRLVLMLICTVLSSAVALLSWNLFEKHFLKLKDRVK